MFAHECTVSALVSVEVLECEPNPGPSTPTGSVSVHLFLPWVCEGNKRGTHSSSHKTRLMSLNSCSALTLYKQISL